MHGFNASSIYTDRQYQHHTFGGGNGTTHDTIGIIDLDVTNAVPCEDVHVIVRAQTDIGRIRPSLTESGRRRLGGHSEAG